MSKEELINYLNFQENKTVLLSLQGIIFLKLEIKFEKIYYDEDYITIKISNNNFSDIKFNLHQLMKIDKEGNKIILEFDQLQSATITIKEEVI